MAKAKTVTATDVKQLTEDQIEKRLVELAKEKMNLRFQKASGQQQNPKAQLPLRKEVARLKTEVSARRNAKKV